MTSSLPQLRHRGFLVFWFGAVMAVAAHAVETDRIQAGDNATVATAATIPGAANSANSANAAAYSFRGKLSWYGRSFAGFLTASGQPFDPDAMTMAHPTLPFGTLVRITNLANRRSAVVRVNDRGPFVGSRVGDVSAAAARELRMRNAGVINARLDVMGSNDER